MNEAEVFHGIVRGWALTARIGLVHSTVQGKMVYKLKIEDVDVVKWCPDQEEVCISRNMSFRPYSEELINRAGEALRNHYGYVKGFKFVREEGDEKIETWDGLKAYRPGMYINIHSGKTRMVGE